MSIYRSTNPLDFGAVDGIVIDEVKSPPSIQGVGANVITMLGQFERGPSALTSVTSVQQLNSQYGANKGYSGYQALRNKSFAQLNLIRVTAAAAAVATQTLSDSTPTAVLTITAKGGKGVYGNSITVAVSAGTVSGKKYVVTDTSLNAVNPPETYDNVSIASIVSSGVFANSKLINVAVLSVEADPVNQAATALSGGTDGTVADSDYVSAMAMASAQGSQNVLFCDKNSATINAALKAHAAAYQDDMVIIADAAGTSASSAITDVASYRDIDGRIIYTYPWINTLLDGVTVLQNPCSWYASVLSQTSPNVDPASADNIAFLLNASSIEAPGGIGLAHGDYINLMNAGISAFEYDADLGGVKIKSGVTTQIADSTKLLVLRRRMADYLEDSAAKFLKLYQNKTNSRANRNAINGAIKGFVKQNQDLLILPKDTDVQSGKSSLVDTESMNTNDTIAAGFLYIVWRQRIFSSNRFIVLMAEISTSVVVVSST